MRDIDFYTIVNGAEGKMDQ